MEQDYERWKESSVAKQIHRVNNSFGAILGFGALLQRHLQQDSVGQDYAEKILQAARDALDQLNLLSDEVRRSLEHQSPATNTQPIGYATLQQNHRTPPNHSTPGNKGETSVSRDPASSRVPDKNWAALGGCENLLVVEDDLAFRSMLNTFFQQLGYQLVCADNGQTAVNLFAQDPEAFDLVCVDRDLPGLDGISVAKQIRNTRPRQRLILLTGAALHPNAEGQALFSAILQKPVPLQHLAEVVRQLLDAPAPQTPQ